ncbi:MAG: transglutaminase-like domain-containing protein [Oscillospiraceae bacterium]|jgi:hypothetical protein|nr:transglutaminase-like domain-containing protein [Oscillospiraceae bacterium]
MDDTILNILARQKKENPDAPVWCVTSELELSTALCMMLQAHYPSVCLVIDNRSGFARQEDMFEVVKYKLKHLGQDFSCTQIISTSYLIYTYAGSGIVAYKITIQYYNSAKEINDMLCLSRDCAAKILSVCPRDDPRHIVKEIQRWFQNNFEYRDTDSPSDHSAVDSMINGYGVCQAIATIAYAMLDACGFDARCVLGESVQNGKSGGHAWNKVKLGGVWYNADFTFGLGYTVIPNPYLLVSDASMSRDHNWDFEEYSDAANDTSVNRRRVFSESVFAFSPAIKTFMVNGAQLTLQPDCPPYIRTGTSEQIALLHLIELLGGYYEYVRETGNISMTVFGKRYIIPLRAFTKINGAYYLDVTLLPKFNFLLSRKGNLLLLAKKK